MSSSRKEKFLDESTVYQIISDSTSFHDFSFLCALCYTQPTTHVILLFCLINKAFQRYILEDSILKLVMYCNTTCIVIQHVLSKVVLQPIQVHNKTSLPLYIWTRNL